MAVTDQDLEAWASRIGFHFDPPLKDLAVGVAGVLAPAVGSRIKALRPETRMEEVMLWLEEATAQGSASLDWVEMLMAVEDRVSSETTDEFAETIERRTFREYVEHLHARRHAA